MLNCVAEQVQEWVHGLGMCASFTFRNSVSAGLLFVLLHQVAHHTTQP